MIKAMKKIAEFQSESWKTIGEIAQTRYILKKFSDGEKVLSLQSLKSVKRTTIIPESDAHLQTRGEKKHTKFQNGPWKTVGGVTRKRYILKTSSDAEK